MLNLYLTLGIFIIILTSNGVIIMKWYHYIAAFFAGAFLANVVPHFIHGISGDPFPSPFANPPGKGLSSPLVNVIWACFNLLAGYVLLRVSKITFKNSLSMLVLFLGILAISIQASIVFMDKMKL
jgi:hypothetical protein